MFVRVFDFVDSFLTSTSDLMKFKYFIAFEQNAKERNRKCLFSARLLNDDTVNSCGRISRHTLCIRKNFQLRCVVSGENCNRIPRDTLRICTTLFWCEPFSYGFSGDSPEWKFSSTNESDTWNVYWQCASNSGAVENFVCLRVFFGTYDNRM